jgi:hypothetical protein
MLKKLEGKTAVVTGGTEARSNQLNYAPQTD